MGHPHVSSPPPAPLPPMLNPAENSSRSPRCWELIYSPDIKAPDKIWQPGAGVAYIRWEDLSGSTRAADGQQCSPGPAAPSRASPGAPAPLAGVPLPVPCPTLLSRPSVPLALPSSGRGSVPSGPSARGGPAVPLHSSFPCSLWPLHGAAQASCSHPQSRPIPILILILNAFPF